VARKRPGHAQSPRFRYRVHAGFIMASAAFAAIFVAVIVGAFHAPAPHDVPVGIVGSAKLTSHAERALDSAVPGGFSLRDYRSEAAATTAIRQGAADGALVASGKRLRLLVAQGGGNGPMQALIRIFGTLAARSGRQLTVADVVPPLPGDTQALSAFFVVLAVLLPSLAAGSASALVFRRARPAWCVGAPITVAVVLGAVSTGIADGIAGLGHYAVIAGIVALFSLAVAAPTAVLARLWPPLVALAMLAFVVLGIPASGGPGNLISFEPDFARVLGSALPLPAAASAVRDVVYFGGHATSLHVWVLGAWALAGVLGLIVLAALRRPALVAARQPAMPSPVRPDSGGGPAERVPVLGMPVPSVTGAGDGRPAPPVALVVGFDDSEPARRALNWAARLLTVRPGVLHVVYADHALIDSDLSGFAHAEMACARDERAARVAEDAAEIAAEAGVPHTFERRDGPAADAILSAASAHAAAEPGSTPVIVAGRSAHTAHQVVGSVPVRLLHHSPYPVLTIA
jgi:nucleotide-binding universal stress UspA family protein